MEIATIKKSKTEANLKVDNLGKRSWATDASISNRIQEIKEQMSGIEDTTGNIDMWVKDIHGVKIS